MIMGVCFEIRGKAYEGRLGPTLAVGPNIRLVLKVKEDDCTIIMT